MKWAGGLLLAGAVFVVSRVFSKNILPAIGPVSLHMYAYMVVFTAILNIANIVPAEIKEGVKRLSNFFTKPLMCYCMFGIGIAFTDLADFLAVLNWQTLLISQWLSLAQLSVPVQWVCCLDLTLWNLQSLLVSAWQIVAVPEISRCLEQEKNEFNELRADFFPYRRRNYFAFRKRAVWIYGLIP